MRHGTNPRRRDFLVVSAGHRIRSSTTIKAFLNHKTQSAHPREIHFYSCSPDDAVDSVRGSVKIKRQSGLPVIDPKYRLIGIVTRDDLVNREGDLVGDIMTTPAISIRDSDTLQSALDLMAKSQVSTLPVLSGEDGRCIGLVTVNDIKKNVEVAQRKNQENVEVDMMSLEMHESGAVDM